MPYSYRRPTPTDYTHDPFDYYDLPRHTPPTIPPIVTDYVNRFFASFLTMFHLTAVTTSHKHIGYYYMLIGSASGLFG